METNPSAATRIACEVKVLEIARCGHDSQGEVCSMSGPESVSMVGTSPVYAGSVFQ
jgi:hypothetical protein